MACIAVTRGGFGDVWLFESRTIAYLHPLVQYGDTLLTGPESVCDQYNWLEWSSLRELAGLGAVTMTARNPKHARDLKMAQASEIYETLVRRAQPAPTDPAEICRLVTQDRRTGTTMARKKDTAPEDTTAPASTNGSGGGRGGGLRAATRGPKGAPSDATITMGVDKDGVSFGPDRNPKKQGSKTWERFKSYTTGMTIQQALEAGLTTADLNYDREHGFISWSGGTASKTPEAEDAAAQAAGETNQGGEGEEDQQQAA